MSILCFAKDYPGQFYLFNEIKEGETDWMIVNNKMTKLLVITQFVIGRAYHNVLVQSGHKVRLPIKVERWLMCRLATVPCSTHKAPKQR